MGLEEVSAIKKRKEQNIFKLLINFISFAI